jgi:hypothetical protein
MKITIENYKVCWIQHENSDIILVTIAHEFVSTAMEAGTPVMSLQRLQRLHIF